MPLFFNWLCALSSPNPYSYFCRTSVPRFQILRLHLKPFVEIEVLNRPVAERDLGRQRGGAERMTPLKYVRSASATDDIRPIRVVFVQRRIRFDLLFPDLRLRSLISGNEAHAIAQYEKKWNNSSEIISKNVEHYETTGRRTFPEQASNEIHNY
ncbi:MAG: hypothetical protein IPJ30_14160 [Acidobacteria bacterium]|nr:hypothetical protein [Acidobacteriota bacterium]